MKTKMTQVTISLLILATQAITTFAAEETPSRKKHTSHSKPKPHHKSKSHKHKKKPLNPIGPGFHYCNSGHVNAGMGCQQPKGTCPEDPKSPNYKYKK